MKMVLLRTTVRTIWNPCFFTDSAAFATCACFSKLLTPPPQHRVDGVSNFAQAGRRRRFQNKQTVVGAVGVLGRGKK